MQKTVVLQKLRRQLGALAGLTIGVLGLPFKPGTDDVRESVAVDLVQLLQYEGVKVKAYDPLAVENARRILDDVEFCPDIGGAADGVDALVIAVEDPLSKNLDWNELSQSMRQRVVIDGRNVVVSERLRGQVVLEQIGRPTPRSDQEAEDDARSAAAL